MHDNIGQTSQHAAPPPWQSLEVQAIFKAKMAPLSKVAVVIGVGPGAVHACREFLFTNRRQASMSSLKSALLCKESERHRPKSLHPRATPWLCCRDPSINLHRSSRRSAKLVAKLFLCPQTLVSLGVVASQLATERAFPQQPASLKVNWDSKAAVALLVTCLR